MSRQTWKPRRTTWRRGEDEDESLSDLEWAAMVCEQCAAEQDERAYAEANEYAAEMAKEARRCAEAIRRGRT